MATILGLVSQKGGVGKSTLARAIAREAAAAGVRVKLADLDTQQGTSSNWLRRRLVAGVEPAFSVESFKTAAQALAVGDGYDLLVLDGPARASIATLEIARQGTLIIQPTSASVDDLHPGVLTFHELAREGVPKSRMVFALCKIGTDAEEGEARTYITQAGFDVLPGSIPERPAYRQAQNIGLTITETRFRQLNRRADALLQHVVDRIANGC
jgi:chromosome partitioning protein